MHNIIITKPYRFVPPVRSPFWPHLLWPVLPRYLRRSHGIESFEILGADRLKASLEARHGIVLTPNHCRPCDPFIIGLLSRQLAQPVYLMASWHLFHQGRFQTWLLRHTGVFSVYREGMDRESLKFAVQAVANAERPLVLFPEGVITRANDRLNHLMEGTAFLARNAARQRVAKASGQVVIHPIAIRYFFGGNLEAAVTPVLEEIERRLTWRPRPQTPLFERIIRIGNALLTLKEIEYIGRQQTLDIKARLDTMIDALLVPLEQEWLKGKRDGDVVARVKSIRAAMLPEMIAGEITEPERARRWEQIADTYLAQQVYLYPPEYFGSHPTPEQLLETVERFEEDLTDTVRLHRPIHAVLQVGEAIRVDPVRDRNAETDPLMARLRTDLETMLGQLKERKPPPS
ncbi:MAG TPA: 1-acyl-sn-glycerol-3-phosphate acyltransferase [Verrucomicrobiota bacterium]|nr:1-acyl-sn-glycerol-3-phosphate acyltransferase [Verrucomicrobiota bacterium]HRZ37580.1 1-acyl-sn-glycerol-3-phosphate acyltransferase [Candidatus Paceibacterota bacterium]HRZ58433.1 1-acyl-sn-glycerol-3-phosphate acyltransferase [Candidatus Paceibacterota bacterium]